MIQKSYAKKLASIGFSLIPCNEKKAPYETEWSKRPIKTPDEIENLNPTMWGCRTGYNDLECIDIDLKIFPTLQERKDWWEEYLSFLSDNIEDFTDKIVIAKTLNGGYHLIYKTNIKEGNQKIARLKEYKEALIETRGVGGQFILYGNFFTKLEYHDVKYITDEEREIIFTISKTYNYINEVEVEKPKQNVYNVEENDITPWEDFNQKNNVLDIISDEFKVVRNTVKSIIVKRNGAKSPHSGYVYKDSGCLYLFSTGTIYPHEKLLSPFQVYTIKNFNGDYNRSASHLYSEGYGTRKLKPLNFELPKEEIINTNFPIDIFPKEIKSFIIESSNTLNLSVDYMGCSFLWVVSLCVGNTMVIEVKPGWREVANLWLAMVGKPGWGKTPAIKQIIAPLQKLNIFEQKDYQKKYKAYKEFELLTKKEKEHSQEVLKPVNQQFILNDVTLEALVQIHEQNPKGVGVFMDELNGWAKDMNKYRAGSDLEFWLSTWSGAPVSLNRKTSDSSFVDKPFISVLGGIQPSIFNQLATGDNAENGFIDRILLSYPSIKVENFNENYMNADALQWYEDFVIKMKRTIDNHFIKLDENNNISPSVVPLHNDSKAEFKRIHDKITEMQNSDSVTEYLKSMLPKQKSYVPRFALLLNTLWSFFDDDFKVDCINKQSMVYAEKVSDYFITMAKNVKIESAETNELKTQIKDKKTVFEKFVEIHKNNPEFNRSKVAELLGISRTMVHKYLKQIENETK